MFDLVEHGCYNFEVKLSSWRPGYIYILCIIAYYCYHRKCWSKKWNDPPYRIQSHWIGGVPNAITEKEPRAARHIWRSAWEDIESAAAAAPSSATTGQPHDRVRSFWRFCFHRQVLSILLHVGQYEWSKKCSTELTFSIPLAAVYII